MKKNVSIFLIAIVFAVILYTTFHELENRKKIETSVEITNIEKTNSELPSGEASEVNKTESGEEISGEISGDNQSGEEKKVETKPEETEEDPSIKYSNQNGSSLKSTTPYYIKVNNLQNVITIYEKDSNGNYTIPYKAMLCSTGIATPKAGSAHKVTTYKNRWNDLEGNVYGQYATQIIGNILFHSVPYTAKNHSSLEYWEYDKLGTSASLGCVRLSVGDAKWIYDNISSGTVVEFYEDENPGPLGKPDGQKISENEELRGWDPTDPDENNPWNPQKIEVQVEEKPALIEEPEKESAILETSSGEEEQESLIIDSDDIKNEEEKIEERVYGERGEEPEVAETQVEEMEVEETEIEEDITESESEEDDWIGSRK